MPHPTHEESATRLTSKTLAGADAPLVSWRNSPASLSHGPKVLSMPARHPSWQCSLVIAFLVALCVIAVAARVSDPDTARAWNLSEPFSPRAPTPAEARQALIEMFEQKPRDPDPLATQIIELVRDQLRQGRALNFIDSENSKSENWGINCDLNRLTFAFETHVVHPSLDSFESKGRFTVNQGRWSAIELYWKCVTHVDRFERSHRRIHATAEH
jgi:hypothetical protein